MHSGAPSSADRQAPEDVVHDDASRCSGAVPGRRRAGPVVARSARVILDVPERPIDLSVGAGYARIPFFVPFTVDGEEREGDPLRIIHFGIGFDLGRPDASGR